MPICKLRFCPEHKAYIQIKNQQYLNQCLNSLEKLPNVFMEKSFNLISYLGVFSDDE